MSIPIEITNPEIQAWFAQQNANEAALQTQTLLLTGLFAAQMLIYYDLWDDAIDNRDAVMDKYEKALCDLHDMDLGVDYTQMLKKQEVLDLPLPAVEMCEDADLWHEEVHNDGQAVDDKCESLLKSSCCDFPEEWRNHEGQLYAARASDYTGGVLANSSKRRREDFIANKTALVLRAQSSAKMSIQPILNNYIQATSIYEGLASTFLQGFNSAGAGLGVNLFRLGSFSGGGSGGP